MTTLEDLERRVSAREKAHNTTTETLEWIAGTLRRVNATVDGHTLRLKRIDVRLDRIEDDVRTIKTEARTFRDALPGIVATAMREVLDGINR